MIVCIGAFDGYHRGHGKLFARARELSRRLSVNWSLLTFEPHPRFVLGGLTARLFTPAEKALLRACLNIPEPVEIPFTKEFAEIEPLEFFNGLRARMPLCGIVVGGDFHFGKNRVGDGAFLKEVCAKENVLLELVPQLTESGTPISSSRVRYCVEQGDLPGACSLLGYPYFVLSRVVTGEQRGRTLGFPTANLTPGAEKLLPCEGVYACAARCEGRWHPASVSVGRNPTFLDNAEVRIEAHLSDFSGDLYGRDLFLAFFQKLRPMRRFNGAQELVAQLQIDRAQTEKIFESRKCQLELFLPPHF